MTTKELRLENFILEKESEKIGIVKSIDKSEIVAQFESSHWTIGIDKIAGVPLTNDWLLKLGFVLCNETTHQLELREPEEYTVFYLDECDIYVHNDGRNGFRVSIEAAGYDEHPCLWSFTNELEYVHQIQNVISATGFIADA